MKIYIIGIGLIGGSMALDIKGLYPEATVYGVDTDEDHLQEALALSGRCRGANRKLVRCRFRNSFGSSRCCADSVAKF
jgi:prephenate dehydrogenase